MRLFFALWPDADTKNQLASVAAKLRLAAPSRLVPADNFHLTLAFVGEVPSSRLPGLLAIGAMQRALRLRISFDATEYWAKSRIVVAAAQKMPPALLKLWEQLHKDLALEAQPDPRAHVTLARKVAQAPVLQAMSPVAWSTSSFGLYRSETGGGKSAYTVVDTWSLLDETEIPLKTR
jgi:RNA 2',3'-cyclic 3'-phosphodiesterase